MATKNQLALLLLMCAVTALLIQPAMGQKDALRWGKRGSELSDDYAENPQTFQRYHHDDDYSRRFLRKGLGSNITDLWNFQTRDEYLVNTHVRGFFHLEITIRKCFWQASTNGLNRPIFLCSPALGETLYESLYFVTLSLKSLRSSVRFLSSYPEARAK